VHGDHLTAEKISAAQMVHALMRFLLAVRYRKSLLFWSIFVCAVCGAVYFILATRYYGAVAQVLVLEADAESGTPTIASEDRWQRTLMPTHRNLLRSAKVVERAIEQLAEPHRIDLLDVPRDQWVARIQQNLSVVALTNTNILEIRYRSKDPQTAATVVNAVLESYVRFIEDTYQGTAQEILQLLTKEKTQLEARLSEKETQLLELRQALADLGLQADGRSLHPMVRKAVDLSGKLTEAQTRRLSLEVAYAEIRRAIETGADLQQYLLSVSELVGQELVRLRLGLTEQDAALQAQLQQKLIEDQAQLHSLLNERGYGWAHPEVRLLEERIRQTQEYLQQYPYLLRARAETLGGFLLGPTLLEMVGQKLAEARALEASYQQQFEAAQAEAVALSGQLAQVDILAREVEWLRNLREVLLKRMSDIDLQQKGREVRAYVIDEPEPNPTPISPDLSFTLLGVFGLGLGIGLALVYIVDILDDRFRSIEEIQAVLGVPVLAMVRQLQLSAEEGLSGLPAYKDPNSVESEAFRTLRTALALSDHPTRLLVMTSPEPSDGKTTVLANLAIAVARSGKRTLLIDADLRRPGLTTLLGMRGVEGLTSVIRGTENVIELAKKQIQHTELAGLDVLPSGPRPTNPAELLGTARFAELLSWVETVYDQVFIDSPPALATSDTAVIGRLTEAVLLVIQPMKSPRRIVMRVVENFRLLKIPVVGMVLNRIDAQKEGYYGYHYYGYSYDYDYGHSGDSEQSSEDPSEGVIKLDQTSASSATASGTRLIIPRRVA